MRPLRLLGVLFVLLAFLAPTVLAEHAYTHRYVVTGRVLDAAGEPAKNVPVDAWVSRYEGARPCSHGHAPQTDHAGDFTVCLHVHGLAGNETVTVNLADETRTFPVDALLRKTVVNHTLNATWEEKEAGTVAYWDTTYRVTGRVLERTRTPVDVEGVTANGTTPHLPTVTVTLRYNDGLVREETARGDTYALYDASFNLAEPLRNGTVSVRYENETRTAPLDAYAQRSDVDLVFGVGPETLPPLPEGPRPGSTTPTPLPAGLALLAGVLAAAGASRATGRR